MKSTDKRRYFTSKGIASTARRREGLGAVLKAAMEAWAGAGVLALLFLASSAYVAFGGAFALEASPIPETETSISGAAAQPAGVSGARHDEKISVSSVNPADYFPAAYVNHGRSGDGNVMTYEHD
jgi:hypothetical protein